MKRIKEGLITKDKNKNQN